MWYAFFVPEDNLQSNDNTNDIMSSMVETTCFFFIQLMN